MAADIPSIEPLQARAGDTWKWTKTLADYPATGYTLKYRFKNANGGFEITASAAGNDYSITAAAATTATYGAGAYGWVAWVETGAESYTVGSGTLTVLPDLRAIAADAALDQRSHARKVLDAIEAVLENRATLDQQSYAINGRSLTRTPIPELLTLRSRYQIEVKNEEAKAKLARGEAIGRVIGVRF